MNVNTIIVTQEELAQQIDETRAEAVVGFVGRLLAMTDDPYIIISKAALYEMVQPEVDLLYEARATRDE